MIERRILGSCLCAAIQFEIRTPVQVMVHCHCSRCRKATGSAHATNLTVTPAQFGWLSGEDGIERFDLAGANSFGKWFCRKCGSPVPRITRQGRIVVVPAGSLDTPLLFEPSDHIFWGSRASWSCSAGDLPTHAEYPDAWKPPLEVRRREGGS